jgi:hypothetical protein
MTDNNHIPTKIEKALKRAEHNAIERERREKLNNKYQQLALSLPNLQNDRRPSKGTILERTLEYGKLYQSLLFFFTTNNDYSQNDCSKRKCA